MAVTDTLISKHRQENAPDSGDSITDSVWSKSGGEGPTAALHDLANMNNLVGPSTLSADTLEKCLAVTCAAVSCATFVLTISIPQ